MKRLMILGEVLCLCAVLLAGCGGTEVDGSSTNEPSSMQEEVIFYNPFTGEAGYEEALLTRRPTAVMINNIQESLPQRGTSEADLIFELPVEGPITRMMAVYHDYEKLPEIGSIRSARHDFVELAKSLNALFLHFGKSVSADEALTKYDIDNIDGLTMSGTAFFHDKERLLSKSTEHCWFSNAELMQAGLAVKEYATEGAALSPILNFAKPEEDVMASRVEAAPAANVEFMFSGACQTTFTYDAGTNLYAKGEYGGDQIDETTGQPIRSANVFLWFTNVGFMDDDYHKEVDLSKGTGYYLSKGKAVEVTYKKSSVEEGIQIFDSDGSPLKVNAGKSYICIVPIEQRDTLVLS